MDDSSLNNEYEAYLAHRKLLLDLKKDSTNSFDKAMLTLGAGGLGFSLTFIALLEGSFLVPCLLIISWGGFVVSLLATTSSFLLSMYAMEFEVESLDLKQGSGEPVSAGGNPWDALTRILNPTSVIAFSIGAAFLALFAVFNLL